MTNKSSFVSRLRQLLAEDPRTAIALLEILGPPPGLARPAPSGEEPDPRT
ncbi:hypothetical protein ACFLR0_00215 [Candidatus Bipolaricaulota bacterium]